MAPSRQQDAIRAAVDTLDHPSADAVFFRVREELPRVSLATIYRNLDQLVDSGALRVRRIGGTKRYDKRLERHAHLHCTVCDRLIDVPLEGDCTRPLLAAAEDAGFVVDDQTVELQGTCRDCRA